MENKWISFEEWTANKDWYNHMDRVAIALQNGSITLVTAIKLMEEYGK